MGPPPAPPGVPVCGAHPQLCFHGACQGQVCVCDPGYTSDVSMFWVNDCNMPTYWMTLLGWVSIAGSALVFMWGLKLLHMKQVRGTVSKGLKGVLAMQIVGMMGGVALLVQQRLGPPYLLTVCVATALMTWVGALFIEQFFKLSVKSLNVAMPYEKQIETTLRCFPLMGGGPFAIGFIGGFITQDDPATYNIIISVMLIVSPILQIVSAPILVRSTNTLVALLREVIKNRPPTASSKNSKQQDKLLKTLINFRNQNLSSMLSYMLTTPVLAIVYLVLGALPFMWIITFFLVILNILVGANFYIFMNSQAVKHSSSSTTRKGHLTGTGTGDRQVASSPFNEGESNFKSGTAPEESQVESHVPSVMGDS